MTSSYDRTSAETYVTTALAASAADFDIEGIVDDVAAALGDLNFDRLDNEDDEQAQGVDFWEIVAAHDTTTA